MSYGGGIFDSAPNNEEISSIEQVIAATANMDTWDNHASTGYAGGSGTYSDPYRIETAGQLAYLAKQSRTTTLTGYYSLENSVDMSEYLWLGIGSDQHYFRGGFFGNYNTVSGITMNVKDSIGSYTGFFNYVGGVCEIEDLILNGGTIVSKTNYVGCLVGRATASFTYGDVYIDSCLIENYTAIVNQISAGLVADPCGASNDGEEVSVNLYNCMMRNCNLISDNYFSSFYSEDGEYTNFSDCAFVDVNFIGVGTNVSSSWMPSICYNCYIKSTDINIGTGENKVNKIMSKGLSSFWDGWFYNSSLNGGYPIQKSFLKIASSITQTGAQVYNYLLSLGFSEV